MNLALLETDWTIDTRLFESFKRTTTAICELLNKGGMPIKPYKPDLPYFSRLSTLKKMEVIDSLEFYYTLCAEQIQEGYELKDSPSFTWRALNKIGMTPPSDLFTRVKDTDIIEIYSKDHVQLFRNFKFFEYCTYTLEELYCMEWFYLYDRDPSVIPSFMADVVKVQEGLFPLGLEPSVGKHFLREANSEQCLEMDYYLRWIAPLFSSKEITGFIVLEEARLHEH